MDAGKSSDRKLVVESVGEREVVMTRVLAAPRHLVFDAWTKPEQVARWFGPRGCTVPVCTIDLRPGGAWRYILRSPDGSKMGMKGVYREVAAPDRLVSTESFDDGEDDSPEGARALFPGESLNTLTLVEQGGLTTLTVHVLYPSREAREGSLQSGMERGAGETFDRLEETLLAQQK
jgi:uncharacterized protein YndB with AHSA1/START domain